MTARIRPAQRYRPPDDLWILTAYFNPAGYATRLRNYEAYADVMQRSGIHLVTVECAFGDAPFVLPTGPDVMQVRSSCLMWQKERLINLAIDRLPARCTKVAWIDGDVLFENPDWAVETSRRLDDVPVVQPFMTAIRLPRDTREYRGDGQIWSSFGAVCESDPSAAAEKRYHEHGMTGFAWAARRDALAGHLLYDACILGGGDHLMAHAMRGTCASPCLHGEGDHGSIDRGHLVRGSPRHLHFLRWARRLDSRVRARIGCVPGAVLHLWHGERANRLLKERKNILKRHRFDPDADLRLGSGGCWEWNSDKPELHRDVAEYFGRRNEDGAAPVEGGSSAPAGDLERVS